MQTAGGFFQALLHDAVDSVGLDLAVQQVAALAANGSADASALDLIDLSTDGSSSDFSGAGL
jgi:hypothetical protein